MAGGEGRRNQPIVGPDEPAGRAWQIVIVLSLATAAHLALSLLFRGFITGDDVEILEAGLSPVTDLTYHAWNIRNLLVPRGLVAPVAWLGSIVGVRAPSLLVELGTLPFVALATLNVYLVYRIASSGRTHALGVMAASIYAVHWLPLGYGATVYPRTVSTACILLAVCLLEGRGRDLSRSAGAGLLVALAFAARYSEAIFLAPLVLMGWTQGLGVRRSLVRAFGVLAGFGLGSAVFVGLVDLWTWGEPFHSLVEFARYTLVERAASSLRPVQGPLWYLRRAQFWLIPTLLPFLLVRKRDRQATSLWLLLILPIVALSFVRHKEMRYLQAVIPFLAILVALGARRLWALGWRRTTAVLLLLSGLFSVRTAVELHRHKSLSAVKAAHDLGADPSVDSVLLIQAWAYGDRLYLRPDVSLVNFDRPPGGDALRRVLRGVDHAGFYQDDLAKRRELRGAARVDRVRGRAALRHRAKQAGSDLRAHSSAPGEMRRMRESTMTSSFPRPRLVLSKCLELEACRYNGVSIRAPLVRRMEPFVELLAVCPEVEVGLGVPRDPVRLVRNDRGKAPEAAPYLMVQPSTGRNLTAAMTSFSTTFLDAVEPVDGFLLKSRSPSCGIKDTKIYTDPATEKGQAMPVEKGSGLFAAAVLERFGDRAIEDEGRLTNFRIRHHFLTKLFTLARLRAVAASGRMKELVGFHARHKLLLMAYHQTAMRAHGAAGGEPGPAAVRRGGGRLPGGAGAGAGAAGQVHRARQRADARHGVLQDRPVGGGEAALPRRAGGVPRRPVAALGAADHAPELDRALRRGVPRAADLPRALPQGLARALRLRRQPAAVGGERSESSRGEGRRGGEVCRERPGGRVSEGTAGELGGWETNSRLVGVRVGPSRLINGPRGRGRRRPSTTLPPGRLPRTLVPAASSGNARGRLDDPPSGRSTCATLVPPAPHHEE